MNDTTSPAISESAKSYGPARPKVPPFARYKGTSAWRKNRRRARVYAAFLAASGESKPKP